MINVKFLILGIGLSFSLSLIILLFFKLISRHLPEFNSRNVPFLGGLTFAIAALASFSFYMKSAKLYVPADFTVAIFFSFIILFTEFLDDLREFSLGRKIFIQSLIFLLFLVFGGKVISIYIFPTWLNYLLTFLWLMGITNAFNHLDIADGLCGGVGLLIALAFSVLALVLGSYSVFVFLVFLSASLFAFLMFNTYPAKIYMGNSGSHFLGFLFATISMNLDYAGEKFPYLVIIPLLILAVPIIDTAFLLYIRPRKKILPFKKSNDHIFMRLIRKGVSYRLCVSLFYLAALVYISTAFLFYFFPFLGLFIFATVLVLTVFLLKNVLLGSE